MIKRKRINRQLLRDRLMKEAVDRKIEEAGEQHCLNCERCTYVGEGGYICDLSNEVVVDDWTPTDSFNECGGKEFQKI